MSITWPLRDQESTVAGRDDAGAHSTISDRLRYDATHDPLTGLGNRAAVMSCLQDRLAVIDRGANIIVHFIDIDRFKLVNDSYGHSVGDEVLRVVAQRFRHTVRDDDFVGRLGGDEFVVVTSTTHGHGHDAQAHRLRAALSEPIDVAGGPLWVDASVGVAVATPGDTRNCADLLRDADTAMYFAKTAGRGRCQVFDIDLADRLRRRDQLAHDLHAAPTSGDLRVAYQPIVDLRTGMTVAVESLLRWSHPTRGSISPAEFIPLAEQSGLINVIGDHALAAACHEVAHHNDADAHQLQLAVNLSALQIDDPSLVTAIRNTLALVDLDPGSLCVEIDEAALSGDHDATDATLRALHRMGVQLAIDDFGTGRCSLARVLGLPIDIVKIGHEFVAALGTSRDAELPAAAIIAMAHAGGRTVTAKGVETQAQRATLERLGCDRAQGYLLGRPGSAASTFPHADP